MSDDDLIRRGDAKAACQTVADEAKSYRIPQMTMGANTCRDAIAALPAVVPGVKPLVFEGRNGFWRADDGIGGFYEVTEVYSAFHMCRIVVGVANKLIPYNSKDAAFGAANVEHQRRILAALTPTPVDASQTPDPVVNAPDPAAIREADWQNQRRVDAMRRRHMNAPEDPHVAALCERYGYGAVMDAASRLWARKDSMGAFYIGGCIGLRSDDEAAALIPKGAAE